MNWLYYLGEANLYLCVFYLCYCLFLNNETHYTLNRVYLLFSCVASTLLPLIQLGFLKPVEQAVQVSGPIPYADNHFSIWDGVLYSYFIGVFILTIQFIVKLYQLQKLARMQPAIENEQYKLIYLEGSTTAFSFFNYLFIGADAPEADIIIRHELVHIRQKHSADILFLEVFKIVNWFNPLVYLLQNSLKSVHEYIADEQTAAGEADAFSYATFLVNNAHGLSGSSITHSFFNYNLLKKRIIMLHQQRSGSLARLKYLVVVPLCAGLLCESTLGFSKTYGWDIAPKKGTAPTISTLKQVPPPPPPAPPKPHVDQIKFPPPVVKPNRKRPKPHVDQVRFPPPVVKPNGKGPKPHVDQVRFPPPVVRPNGRRPKPHVDQVRFPPPVVRPNGRRPKPHIDQVRFPPPVVRPNGRRPKPHVDQIKFPSPVVKRNVKHIAPPPPPQPPVKK